MLTVFRQAQQLSAEHPLYGHLRDGVCTCLINGAQHDPARPIPAAADVIVPMLVARPFCHQYSVLGTIEGAINRMRQPGWSDTQCVMDAVANAPRTIRLFGRSHHRTTAHWLVCPSGFAVLGAESFRPTDCRLRSTSPAIWHFCFRTPRRTPSRTGVTARVSCLPSWPS